MIERELRHRRRDLPIVDLVQPKPDLPRTTDELTQNGYTVDDVARYIMTFTQAQTAGGGVVPNPGQENDPVFAGGVPVGV